MAPSPTMSDEQRRLLRILGLMPLASVSNLAPVLGTGERSVRRMLNRLRRDGWAGSVRRGMTERRQERWFPTRQAVDMLYASDHQHPAPREVARAALPQGYSVPPPADFSRRFAADHEHQPHREHLVNSPFAAGVDGAVGEDTWHEHPPWTATSRGVEMSLRRLAMLEPMYRLAPELLTSGHLRWPAGEAPAGRDLRMTDFRLLRHGGFYHAVARYGPDVWTPFIYAGLHATERALRRKEQHQLWGVDAYLHDEDRYLRIANRVFYEDPDQAVQPSARVVVAVDRWAAELARRTLTGSTPTLIWSADAGYGGTHGGAEGFQRPGVGPGRPSGPGEARERRALAGPQPRSGRARRSPSLPVVHDRCGVSCHASVACAEHRWWLAF